MRPLAINVTADDVLWGEPGNACFCPVARAVRRAIPGARVAVWSDRIEINCRPYFVGPEFGVGEWVKAFDQRSLFGGPEPLPLSFVVWVDEREFGAAERAVAA